MYGCHALLSLVVNALKNARAYLNICIATPNTKV